jgi:hypothetical protein
MGLKLSENSTRQAALLVVPQQSHRPKGPPLEASTEGAHPHAVWIKAPPSGFGELLISLRDLASAVGAHAVTLRLHHTGERVRFRFKVAEHAAIFRSAATVICPDLVEPRWPREGSNR